MITETISVAKKFNASWMLWWNGRFFAERCRKLEQQHAAELVANGQWTELEPRYRDGIIQEHRAYSVAAVMQSMTALESGINEFYADLDTSGSKSVKSIDSEVRRLLIHSWPLLDSAKTFDKFNWALSAAGKEPFVPGCSPGNDFHDLKALRNAIIHYRPEWDYEDGDHKKLTKRLASKFAASALMAHSSEWFPLRCFGAGCSEWSVGVAESFAREFCERMGIPFWFVPAQYPTPQPRSTERAR